MTKFQIKLVTAILLFSICLFSRAYANNIEEEPWEFDFIINSHEKNPLDFGSSSDDCNKKLRITMIDERYVQIVAERWYKPTATSITFGMMPYAEPSKVKLIVPYVCDSANKNIHIIGNVLGNKVTEIPNEDGILNWIFLNLENFQGITLKLDEEGNFKSGTLYSVDGSIFDIYSTSYAKVCEINKSHELVKLASDLFK